MTSKIANVDLFATWRTLLLGVLVVAIAACGDNSQTEMREWMDAERARTPAIVPPLAAPVVFAAAPYSRSSSVDPFDEMKLKAALLKSRGTLSVSALQPDLKRKLESLEAFPLNNLRMIGFVLKQNKPTALILASGTLYNVMVGHYLGQDFGRVIDISENEVTVKELIQDGAGVWTERISKLALIAAVKENKK